MPEANHELHASKRAEYSQKVLDSSAEQRLVMAGPGTGKSYLFQQVAKSLREQGKENILVLTFINELVKDLAIDMHGLAEVFTLHSFAAKKLQSRQKIYMKLLAIAATDYKVHHGETANYSEILNNLDISGNEAKLEYLATKRQYYKSYDTTSIVYDLVRLFESDPTKIPVYDLIMIDEYQDFNNLEAKLIELLATKSPVLIAGDDDQSLYSFKHAKPENIRNLHTGSDYETFELPYCSRSTAVVIDAFHDFLVEAQSNGHLVGRVDKQYLYFPDPKKDKYSEQFPKIEVRMKVYETMNAYTIDQSIKEIFTFEPSFDVLIICPLKKQIPKIADALRKKGYINVSGDEGSKGSSDVLADGLRILLEDKDSNLGWRLCAEALLELDALDSAIIKSSDNRTLFRDCLENDAKQLIKKLRAITVKLKDNQSINDEERGLLFEKLGIDASSIGEQLAKKTILETSSSRSLHSSVKIKVTTILGSKGLSYDYVFMINFDNRFLIPNNGRDIDDESINKFLVALTRSRKRISIFTSKNSEPTFVSWINPERKTVTS